MTQQNDDDNEMAEFPVENELLLQSKVGVENTLLMNL